MKYRTIKPKEIIQLEKNGCSSRKWKKVFIRGPIKTDRIIILNSQGL